MSTNFLGAKGQPRRGLDLNSELIGDKKPSIIQDAPKENYLLCEECEAYFSVLEGIASEPLLKWAERLRDGSYSQHAIIPEVDLIMCTGADSKTNLLLLYSIFWRASVSQHPFFENFKLQPQMEESLRAILMAYRHAKRQEYLQALAEAPTFKVYPTTVITAHGFEDGTANLLMALPTSKPYALNIDRFGLCLYEQENQIHPVLKQGSNLKLSDCNIMALSIDLWQEQVVRRGFDVLAASVKNKKKTL